MSLATRDLKRCPNKVRRLNLKSKRRRNMVKKAIELTKMLDMDILMVMRDNDTGKYFHYASGNKRTGHFTWERTLSDIQTLRAKDMEVRFYDDDDYYTLRTTKADTQEDEQEQTSFNYLRKRPAAEELSF